MMANCVREIPSPLTLAVLHLVHNYNISPPVIHPGACMGDYELALFYQIHTVHLYTHQGFLLYKS